MGGRENSLKNLKTIAMMTPEEKAAFQSKGRKKGAEVKRQRKALREAVAVILSMPAKLDGTPLLGPDGEPMVDMQEAVIVATLRQALSGDVKAAAKIMEWLGEVDAQPNVTINVGFGDENSKG